MYLLIAVGQEFHYHRMEAATLNWWFGRLCPWIIRYGPEWLEQLDSNLQEFKKIQDMQDTFHFALYFALPISKHVLLAWCSCSSFSWQWWVPWAMNLASPLSKGRPVCNALKRIPLVPIIFSSKKFMRALWCSQPGLPIYIYISILIKKYVFTSYAGIYIYSLSLLYFYLYRLYRLRLYTQTHTHMNIYIYILL